MTILMRSFSPLKIQQLSTTVINHISGKTASAASNQKQQKSSDSSKHAKKKTESQKKIPTYLNESEYIKKELPKPFGNFLLNTRIKTHQGDEVSPLDYLQTVGSDFSILVNPDTADRIVNLILNHTRKGRETIFYDNLTGFCLISAGIIKSKKFKRIKILPTDHCLQPWMQFSLDQNILDRKYFKLHPITFRCSSIAAKALRLGIFHPTPFLPLNPQPGWDKQAPPYTLVSTVSDGFIKYLTMAVLFRKQGTSFTDFRECRPEFFFFMSAPTYFHICGGEPDMSPATHPLPPRLMQKKQEKTKIVNKYNIRTTTLFRLLFDFYLIDTLPTSSFLPWRQNRVSSVEDKSNYDKYADQQLLVYARPKQNPGIHLSNPGYLQYFIEVLMRKKKSVTVLPILESWMPGLGQELIRLNHSVFTTPADLKLSDLVHLFNHLVQHQLFKNSSFKAAAEAAEQFTQQGTGDNEKEIGKAKKRMLRKLRKRSASESLVKL